MLEHLKAAIRQLEKSGGFDPKWDQETFINVSNALGELESLVDVTVTTFFDEADRWGFLVTDSGCADGEHDWEGHQEGDKSVTSCGRCGRTHVYVDGVLQN